MPKAEHRREYRTKAVGTKPPLLRDIAFALAGVTLLAAGCATLPPEPPGASREAACYRFFTAMDRLTAAAGTADAAAARIAGFPHLRATRLLASFAADRPQGEAYRFWLEALRRTDAQARHIELSNLPAAEQRALRAHWPAAMPADQAIAFCGERLLARDSAAPERREPLLQQARVPDAYRPWQRIAGLYPLTRIAFAAGVTRLQRNLRQAFAPPLSALPTAGQLVRYQPPAAAALPREHVAQILADASRNALAIPEPGAAELAQLFQTFAPIFEIDTQGHDDRIGTIRLQGRAQAAVDVTAPAVYRLASRTRFGEQTLLQLNYVVWFPARPPESVLDIYAGRFDGLIWRVTLSPTGEPLAYDSIHPCGCYYLVFPSSGWRVVQPEDGSEPILAPQTIAAAAPGSRPVIRLATGTHFIQRVYAGEPARDASGYHWLDYDDLRSLPAAHGRHRSLFDQAGFVPDSERAERFLYWPMGVPSAGAMRQWGSHAIAFLGRRHFDDPRLLETLLRPAAGQTSTE